MHNKYTSCTFIIAENLNIKKKSVHCTVLSTPRLHVPSRYIHTEGMHIHVIYYKYEGKQIYMWPHIPYI